MRDLFSREPHGCGWRGQSTGVTHDVEALAARYFSGTHCRKPSSLRMHSRPVQHSSVVKQFTLPAVKQQTFAAPPAFVPHAQSLLQMQQSSATWHVSSGKTQARQVSFSSLHFCRRLLQLQSSPLHGFPRGRTHTFPGSQPFRSQSNPSQQSSSQD
jgi:hypothetical protein